jgi:hypothetical protein
VSPSARVANGSYLRVPAAISRLKTEKPPDDLIGVMRYRLRPVIRCRNRLVEFKMEGLEIGLGTLVNGLCRGPRRLTLDRCRGLPDPCQVTGRVIAASGCWLAVSAGRRSWDLMGRAARSACCRKRGGGEVGLCLERRLLSGSP